MFPQFTVKRTTTAVNEIIARAAIFNDENGQTVFATCERGAIMTVENMQVPLSALPAFRVWYPKTGFNMGVTDFVIAGDVGGRSGITKTLNLDSYFYSTDKDASGSPLDLQAKLEEFTENLIYWFNDVDPVHPFIHSTNIWGFTRTQRVTATYNTTMRRFGRTAPLPPGWYTSTIELDIDVYPA